MNNQSLKRSTLIGGLALLISYTASAQSQNLQNLSSSEQEKIAATIDSILLAKTPLIIMRQGSGADKALFEKIDKNYPLNKDLENYFEIVDSIEKSKSFVQLTPYEKNIYLKESIDTMLTTIRENQLLLQHIEHIDMEKTNIEDIPPEHYQLKFILSTINANLNDELYLNRVDKLSTIYNFLRDNILMDIIPETAPLKENIVSNRIDKILGGAKGNCNDIAPAYVALFNHFGYNAYLRVCAMYSNNEKTAYHAYVCIVEKEKIVKDGKTIEREKIIDFDPMWYSSFIPLKERNFEIEKLRPGM